MKKYGDVRTTTGVPVVADFNNPSGTPIVINLATGIAYYLDASNTVQPLTGGSGAPTNAEYVVMALNGSLSAERVLTAGAGISITDGGANGPVTIAATGAAAASAPQGLWMLADGMSGEDGMMGPRGADGAAGSAGAAGAAGPAIFMLADDGQDGDQGPPGAPGAPGATGAPGVTSFIIWELDGTPGDDGMIGPTGPQGPAGGGGGGGSWTETEVDFGTLPVYTARFTVSDGTIASTSKVPVLASGKVATGRAEGDDEWDQVTYSALPATGSMTVYAVSNPGPVVGRRKIQYQVGT